MLLAVRHLPGGEHDVDQVLLQLAGEGAAQEGEVLLRLVLGHDPQRGVQVGDDLLVGVDVATIDFGDGILVRLEPAAQLADFTLIHGDLAL